MRLTIIVQCSPNVELTMTRGHLRDDVVNVFCALSYSVRPPYSYAHRSQLICLARAVAWGLGQRWILIIIMRLIMQWSRSN